MKYEAVGQYVRDENRFEVAEVPLHVPNRCAMADQIADALNADAVRGEVAVPQGWKLVPAEPTEEMTEAARRWQHEEYVSDPTGDQGRFYAGAYRAMLAAAPAAPQELGCDACFERHCDGANCTEQAATTHRE